jgi:hypothetical protein
VHLPIPPAVAGLTSRPPDQGAPNPASDTVAAAIVGRIGRSATGSLWRASDFCDIGGRAAVDTALHRLANDGTLRRIQRGIYDKAPLGGLAAPGIDIPAIVRNVAERYGVRIMIGRIMIGERAASCALGITRASHGAVTYLSDGRLKSLRVGDTMVRFRKASERRMYWADRPAMHDVQALYSCCGNNPRHKASVIAALRKAFVNPILGAQVRADLENGRSRLPSWIVRMIDRAITA